MQTARMLMLIMICQPLVGHVANCAEKPNVILVMADDLGWGDLKAFNPDSHILTPHLDEMAAAGLKFNRFYSAGPVCSPTRGSCLTGRHPFRYGIYTANVGHMKPEEITLPEILKKHGYTTGHFGKWHLGTLTTEIKDANRGGPKGKKNFSPPQQNGYDRCFVTESKVPTHNPMLMPAGGGNQNGWQFLEDLDAAEPYGTRYWDESGNVVTDGLLGDDSKVIMDRAIPFIEAAVQAETPFFAVIWFHAPHLPVVAGPEHLKPYEGLELYKRNYYGCITALDEQVGRLRSSLKNMNVADNTMVWFCSDNGPEGQSGQAPGSAGPLRGRKRDLYEGGVRVPAFLDWPGHVSPGSETDVPCVTSDYLPTVLDALRVTYSDDRPIDGVSLLPIISRNQNSREKPIGFQSGRVQTWVTDQYKLYTPDRGKTFELYDIVADPAERTDIANQHPEIVTDFSKQLAAWVASCKFSDNGGDY